MYSQKVTVSVGVSVIVVVSVLALILFTHFRTKNVSFVSQNQGVTNNLQQQSPSVNKLTDLQIIDNKSVKNIKIVVTSQNTESMYAEAGPDGNEYISSKYEVDQSGNATITLFAGDVFLTLPKTRQAQLLNTYFWKVADLIIKRNTHSLHDNVNNDHPDIFFVKQ